MPRGPVDCQRSRCCGRTISAGPGHRRPCCPGRRAPASTPMACSGRARARGGGGSSAPSPAVPSTDRPATGRRAGRYGSTRRNSTSLCTFAHMPFQLLAIGHNFSASSNSCVGGRSLVPGRCGRCGSCPAWPRDGSGCTSRCITPSLTASPEWRRSEGSGFRPDPAPSLAAPWTPAPMPSSRELLVDNLRRRWKEATRTLSALARPVRTARYIKAGWPAVRETLSGDPAPRTGLNATIGRDRRLALIDGDLHLATLVAHASNATVNDVLMAAIAGGLRDLLSSRGELVDDLVLRAYVPSPCMDSSEAQHEEPCRRVMAVSLPVAEADPVEGFGRSLPRRRSGREGAECPAGR